MISLISLLLIALHISLYGAFVWHKNLPFKYSINSNIIDNEGNAFTIIQNYLNVKLANYAIKSIYLNTGSVDTNLSEETINLSFWSKKCNISSDAIVKSTLINDFDCLQIPLLNFDLTLANKKIADVFDTPPTRRKPLLAIVRGTGGGKTRAIDEMGFSFQLMRNDCLAIPITLNSNTGYLPNLEIQPLLNIKTLIPEYSIVISVAVRMIVMFYESLSFTDGRDIIYGMLNDLSSLGRNVEGFIDNLLCALISHMKSALELKNKYIKSFVLFIDESAIASDKFNNAPDVYSLVRQFIYSEDFDKYAKSALVMSSLKNSNFYQTISSPAIEVILIAETLDVEPIVDDIWIPTIQKLPKYTKKYELISKYRDQLLLLASVVNTAPRMVEIVNLILEKYLTSNENNLDSKVISYVLTTTVEQVSTRYNNDLFPKGKYLKALINGKEIECDPEVFDLILLSTYVNQIKKFTKSPKITPTGNFMYLNAILKSMDKKTDIEIKIEELFDLFSDYIVSNKPSGKFLEIVLMKWTTIKLLSMTLLSENQNTWYGTLSELFCIKMDEIYSRNLRNSLINPNDRYQLDEKNLVNLGDNFGNYRKLDNLLNIKFPIYKLIANANITSSVRDIQQWKDDMKNSNYPTVALLNPFNEDKSFREHYNLGLLLPIVENPYLIAENPCVIAFMDAKSKDEKPDIITLTLTETTNLSTNSTTEIRNVLSKSTTAIRKKGKPLYYQYFDMCNVQNSISENDVEGLNSTSNYLRTMYEGNWLYIYQTTYDGPNIYLTREDFEDVGFSYHKKIPGMKYGSLLIINRDSTFNYLSFISEAYKVIRNQANKDKNDL